VVGVPSAVRVGGWEAGFGEAMKVGEAGGVVAEAGVDGLVNCGFEGV